MPVCFFNNQEKKYRCEYRIDHDGIEVIVDYNITEEIEEIDGVRSIGINTKYEDRDILIVDHENNSILVKKAYYNGHEDVFGTPDSSAKTQFKSYVYFVHNDYNKLSALPSTPKVNSIRIYSCVITQLIGQPSLTRKINDDRYEIHLSRLDNSKELEINKKNIKSIRVSDTWNVVKKPNTISIDLNGYVEINLKKRVNYNVIYQYINEFLIFMQLYIPNAFSVDAIKVSIDDTYYTFVYPTLNIEQKDETIKKSVDVDLLDFIEKCYYAIPYRNSKSEIRNIPYIINKATHVEDNFLMFYRFIECYYKKQSITQIQKTFIFYSINKHYCKFKELTNEEVDNYTHEIIALRNHYIHAGYYIKNSSLKIRFEKIDNHKNPKDYTANNVDVYWILERTEILYKIAVDIIFTEMLKYDEYRYKN